MNRSDLEGVQARGIEVVNGFKAGLYRAVLGGNITLTVNHPTLISLDPDGSNRDVTLPAVADAKGMIFIIMNWAGTTSSESLVVKNAGGSTIGTVDNPEIGIFVCDGVAWMTNIGKAT